MGCVPCTSGPEGKVDVVGLEDVTRGNVDLLKHITCHHHGWRELCCGPGGEKSQEFKSRELEREVSMRASRNKTLKPKTSNFCVENLVDLALGHDPWSRGVGKQRKKGEMNKIKPPTFDGEHKKEEYVKTWFLGMWKYFQLKNYSSHVEGRIAMYQLKAKASMWWDKLVQVQYIREKDITWTKFKRYFKKKYLTKRYYDRKMKEFFELKLSSMTIDEYEQRFLELLKYVPFIKDETVKIQRYLSGLPPSIGDKIQYDDPKTMEEMIRRAKCLYEQQKEKPTFQKAWEDKKKFNKEHRKKGTKSSFFRNNPQGQPTFREPRKAEMGGQIPR
jgi:hypothetical protein